MSTNTKILGALSSYLVIEDGSVNWDATLTGIQSALDREIRAAAEMDGKIESALDSLYNALPAGTGVPTGDVTHEVASMMSGGNFARKRELVGVIEDYLARSTRFQAKRGRSGGLFRVG